MDGEAIGQATVQPQPAGTCDAAVSKRWPMADELLKNDHVSQITFDIL
jgi:hypothetical protein